MANNIQFGDNISVTQTQVTNITKAVTILSGGFDDLAKAIDGANKFMENLGDNIADCAPGIDKVSKSLAGLAGSTGDAAGAMGSSIGGALSDVGSGIGDMGSSIGALGSGIGGLGDGISGFVGGISDSFNGVVDVVGNFGTALQSIGGGINSIGEGFEAAAAGLTALAMALPLAGRGMIDMAVSISGITEYIGPLLIFVGVLAILALLGPGLASAGEGLLNIGLGMLAMIEALYAVVQVLPLFLEQIAAVEGNLVGIILFILLAVAVLIMAISLEKINEQLSIFNQHMSQTVGMFTTEFIICFGVFAIMCVLLALVLDKVASGIDKVTAALKRENTQLAIQNPLLAAKAILSNPIIGAITVELAVAGALLVKTVLPGMATGGIVSSPTVALVGEGKYPEAVVPLGQSPQFKDMKADIANTVIQAMSAMNDYKGGGNQEVVLSIDGNKLARAIIPELKQEFKRTRKNMAFGV